MRQDSVCSMQWAIQMKDKQIAVISEKLNSHLVLFGSVEKEVAAVKQALGDVQCLVGEKENVVAELKGKVQRVSVLEKEFVEILNFLENKISTYQLELRSRARIIYELKDRLEAEKLSSSFQPQLEALRKALSVKDEVIERLTSEKQAMNMELHNMEIALQKFQDIFSSIGHEGMKGFSPVSESQDVQDVHKEQFESIPGAQCGLHTEKTLVTAMDEAATTPSVEHQAKIIPGSTQVPSPLKSLAIESPEPLPATAKTKPANCALESRGDIDMGNLSPVHPTYSGKPDPNLENQS